MNLDLWVVAFVGALGFLLGWLSGVTYHNFSGGNQ